MAAAAVAAPLAAAGRLAAVRTAHLGADRVAALLVPTGDAHASEYISLRDQRRQWLTGFTGSAGVAVVTADAALLFTDGRYWLQAEAELDTALWTLMPAGKPGTPTPEEWLASNLKSGDAVGVNPFLITSDAASRMRTELERAGVELRPILPDPIDAVRVAAAAAADAPPAEAAEAMVPHRVEYAGRPFADKLADVRKRMAEDKATALMVSALDEVAWLFNVRGSDIEYNPVAIAYAAVTADSAHLFLRESKRSAELVAHLAGLVELHDYDEVVPWLQAHCAKTDGARVSMDPGSTSLALTQAVSNAAQLRLRDSPIPLFKGLKNDVELEGARRCQLRDGAALVNFLSWLEANVPDEADASFTEYTVSERLTAFRAEQDLFMGPSFATIAGSGANGAVIHYKPEPDTAAPVVRGKMFLCDSGGQYLDGTTDTTRTVHFGEPTKHERACFTRVLQGHIALATVVFPVGTSGHRLDSLARLALWKAGLDYAHGTGHGVGSFLNVHEGPHGIGSRPRQYTAGMRARMVVTNEPGYYEAGAFGVRIENVMVCEAVDTEHGGAGEHAGYLGFETITMAPIQTRLVDASLMSPAEISWLNAYNARVRDALSPLLRDSALEWLRKETAPV